LKIICNNCHSNVRIPDDPKAGGYYVCGKCKQQVTVPVTPKDVIRVSPINAPNCISCGLGGVYHRVTNPKPWRCRTCGSEFNDDDVKRKEEDRRAFEARQASIRAAEERKRVEEAKRQEAEINQWLSEHHVNPDFPPFEDFTYREITALKRFEANLGREIDNSELTDIGYDFMAEFGILQKNRVWNEPKLNRILEIHTHSGDPKPRETPRNTLRWVIALMVIGAIIGYAC
jgi:hypothetical protein